MLSDNEADHRFRLKANAETERLVVQLQGQEEHMQTDISVVPGTSFPETLLTCLRSWEFCRLTVAGLGRFAI